MPEPTGTEADHRGTPVAAAIAGRGVDGFISKNEYVSDVVVLTKIVDMESGVVRLGLHQSPDTDWLTVTALIVAADRLPLGIRDSSDDDEDGC
jgi:hypothetical protein